MTEEQIIRAVDAAMVEMENIHPPLRRSECERLIRAALAAINETPAAYQTAYTAGERDRERD